jgi:hypothetical protein
MEFNTGIFPRRTHYLTKFWQSLKITIGVNFEIQSLLKATRGINLEITIRFGHCKKL